MCVSRYFHIRAAKRAHEHIIVDVVTTVGWEVRGLWTCASSTGDPNEVLLRYRVTIGRIWRRFIPQFTNPRLKVLRSYLALELDLLLSSPLSPLV